MTPIGWPNTRLNALLQGKYESTISNFTVNFLQSCYYTGVETLIYYFAEYTLNDINII